MRLNILLRSFCLGAALTVLAMDPQPSRAQESSNSRESIAALLKEIDEGERGVMTEYDESSVTMALQEVVEHRDSLSGATLDSLLSGLSHLAGSENQRVRSRAVDLLASYGDPNVVSTPLDGVLARLIRIYDSTSDEMIRGHVIVAIPDLHERNAALPFLRGIVTGTSPARLYEGSSDEAVRALEQLGRPGKALLRQLYESNRIVGIRDVDTGLWLRDLAVANGWMRGRQP
jgi:hypothetical protein